jgi:hypothetical protein
MNKIFSHSVYLILPILAVAIFPYSLVKAAGDCGPTFPNGCSTTQQCVSLGSGAGFTCIPKGSTLQPNGQCTGNNPTDATKSCACEKTTPTAIAKWTCTTIVNSDPVGVPDSTCSAAPKPDTSTGATYRCIFQNGKAFWVCNSGTACPSPVAPTTPKTPTGNANTCGGKNGQLGYCPLEPIKGYTDSLVDFPTFINGLFRILFTLGALVAVARMVIGGIMYMVSEVVETKSRARVWMTSSLWGLAIIAGSYLILHEINPKLLDLNFAVPGSDSIVLPSPSGGSTPVTDTGGSALPTNAEKNSCEQHGGHWTPEYSQYGALTGKYVCK